MRIELPGADRILSLAEVRVFADGVNVARQGTATQCHTAFEGNPARAIDGTTDGNYFAANSVTHSETNATAP